ncbi:MAG: site-specific integrase [Oscillospiraceae bacterium]|nr:site-specific integrase [Oscillospiraceae bacterium]
MSRRGENIYKRKDGRWEGRYKVGQDDKGRTKYHSVYAKSYQEVKKKLAVMKFTPVQHKNAGNLTVYTLFEEWMSAVKLKVKASTYANYRMKVDKHILPEFGKIKYEDLTAQMIHSFIQNKLNNGLSAKYVSDIVIVFKSMAKYISIVHEFQNPIANVVLPKAKKKEMVLLTEEQQKHLCGHLLQDMNTTSLGVMLSLYTGLRIGEVCGLKWSDIDFGKCVLSVNRSVQRIRNINGNSATKLLISTPKSETSKRSIPLPTFLIKFLQKFRGVSTAYVLSGSDKVIEPRTMQYRFKTILKKANLPSINYHSLRHIFATNSIKAGFDIKTLSELLGHATVETTLNRYVHSSIERKIECMNLLQLVA